MNSTRSAVCPQQESMVWKRGRPAVYLGLVTVHRSTLLYLLSSGGFNCSAHLSLSLSPPPPLPRPVLGFYHLAASLRSTLLYNPTHFRSLSAGRPQPGYVL